MHDAVDQSGPRSYLYLPSECGYLFVTRESVRVLMPHHATILLTDPQCPARIIRGDTPYSHCAMAVRSGATQLISTQAPVIKVGINPLHPHFRNFSNCSAADVTLLDRVIFAPLEPRLTALINGEMSIEAVRELMEEVVTCTIRTFSSHMPPNSRQQKLAEVMREHPDSTLHDLAAALNLSYHRMSHAFKELTGLSLRNFKAWQKLHNLVFLLNRRCTSMTDVAHAAGFTDSAHLLRQFQQNYGASPKYYFNNKAIKVVVCERLKQMVSSQREKYMQVPQSINRRTASPRDASQRKAPPLPL